MLPSPNSRDFPSADSEAGVTSSACSGSFAAPTSFSLLSEGEDWKSVVNIIITSKKFQSQINGLLLTTCTIFS